MAYVTSNLRLKELVLIAESNYVFYRAFQDHLNKCGYKSIFDFVIDNDSDRAFKCIRDFLEEPVPNDAKLVDGVGAPFPAPKAKWLFMGWLLRDAPEQRLRPMISSSPGATTCEKQAWLLNEIRKDISGIYPDARYWEWPVIREVFVDRLEGSRRAKKGTLFEAVVRRSLEDLFLQNGLKLTISEAERRIEGETYDVTVTGPNGSILLPVKTRETMGGGHAQLFTRDIHKSISVAEGAGYTCIPVIIAESWGGDLASLKCENHLYFKLNPNQIGDVEKALRAQLKELIPVFERLL